MNNYKRKDRMQDVNAVFQNLEEGQVMTWRLDKEKAQERLRPINKVDKSATVKELILDPTIEPEPVNINTMTLTRECAKQNQE